MLRSFSDCDLTKLNTFDDSLDSTKGHLRFSRRHGKPLMDNIWRA